MHTYGQTDRAAGKGQGKSQTRHQPTGRAQRGWSGELPGAQGGRGEDKSRHYTSGRVLPAPPFLLPAEQHCPLPCQLSRGSCLPLQVDPAAWAGGVGVVGWPGVTLPPMGAAKQQPTPTAQAAASISMFLASFCEGDRSEWALPPNPRHCQTCWWAQVDPSGASLPCSPRRSPQRGRGSG